MPLRIAPSEEALFRYLVVSAVLVRTGQGMTQGQAVAEVAGTPFPALEGELREATRRTIYRWHSGWKNDGIAGLEPVVREAGQASRALSSRLITFLVEEKGADPKASIPEVIRRARLRGVIASDEEVDRVTAWRAVRRMGVSTRRRKQPHGGDTRSFEYPHRMQMLRCDGKHFRAGKAASGRAMQHMQARDVAVEEKVEDAEVKAVKSVEPGKQVEVEAEQDDDDLIEVFFGAAS